MGSYLRQKYRGTPQELQDFHTEENNWDDPTCKTMIESLSKRTRTSPVIDVATLEGKIESVKSSITGIDDMKALVKHYLKKELKPGALVKKTL